MRFATQGITFFTPAEFMSIKTAKRANTTYILLQQSIVHVPTNVSSPVMTR